MEVETDGRRRSGVNLRKGRWKMAWGAGGGQRAPAPAERPLIGAAGRAGRRSLGGEPGGGRRGRTKIEPAD